MPHPYRYLIERYFPAEAWGDAECISSAECSPDRAGYPQTCIGYEGWIDCGGGAVEARSWGPWQILDACWSPFMNPNSPFSAEQWGMVLDPNVNTWMASVIFYRNGWSAWTTCAGCGVCAIEPPPGWQPLSEPLAEGPWPPPPLPQATLLGLLGVALLAAGGVMLLTGPARSQKLLLIQERRR